MGDLLPCPFCGGPGGMVTNGDWSKSIMCCKCGVRTPGGKPERAIAAWNTRALPAASPADGAEAPAHAEPVARVNMADWSDLPDVYVTKAECQQGMFWRIEACSVPMAIGPEVRLIRADKMLARPPTDAAEIERLKADIAWLKRSIFGSANYDPSLPIGSFAEMAQTTEAARVGGLARAEKAEAERDEALRQNAQMRTVITMYERVAGLQSDQDQQDAKW